MSKECSADLFDLIQSMGKIEKRDFKIYANRYIGTGDKKYILLFDAILAQKQYDETALRKKFRHEKFIRQFAVAKNYLYNLILDSLNGGGKNMTPIKKVNRILDNVECLFDRSLIEQSKKELLKAKKIADGWGNQLVQLKILEWEKTITMSRINLDTLESLVKDRAEFHLINSYKRVVEYRILSHKLYLLTHRIGLPRTSEEKNSYKALLDNPLLQIAHPEDLTRREKLFYYNFHVLYALALHDFEKAYHNSKKLVDYLESIFHSHPNEVNNYVRMLHNLMSSQIGTKRIAEFAETIRKAKSLLKDPPEMLTKEAQTALSFSVYTMELSVYKNNFQFEEVLKTIKAIEIHIDKSGVGKTGISETQFLLYCFNISNTYMFIGNYVKSLEWTNRFFRSNLSNTRLDLHNKLKILFLIAHYEIGNEELLEYAVKWTYRDLLKRERLYKYEAIVLNFIKKRFPKANSSKELVAAFKTLRDELMEAQKDPYEKDVMKYFDVVSWLESKIYNRPFLEIMKEKEGR